MKNHFPRVGSGTPRRHGPTFSPRLFSDAAYTPVATCQPWFLSSVLITLVSLTGTACFHSDSVVPEAGGNGSITEVWSWNIFLICWPLWKAVGGACNETGRIQRRSIRVMDLLPAPIPSLRLQVNVPAWSGKVGSEPKLEKALLV